MDELSVQCPVCGAPATIRIPVRKASDEFCASCDLPLFWLPEVVALDAGEHDSSPPCPVCARVNPPDAAFCNRCGVPL